MASGIKAVVGVCVFSLDGSTWRILKEPAVDQIGNNVECSFDSQIDGVVRIQAYRGSPILGEPVVSDSNGNFAIEVRAGEPFLVRFMGTKKIPELQELAGKGMTQNEIHVALVTKEQYESMNRLVPVEAKLKYMLKQLPDTDYQHRWHVWVIHSDSSRSEAPLCTPVMCVSDGEVTNPLGTSGHQQVAGWYVDFMNASKIEIIIDTRPAIRIRHPRP